MNATPKEYNGIYFKSKLEITVFKTLQDLGFNPMYESHTYILQEGFKTMNVYYRKTTSKSEMTLGKIIQPITYTPDIEITDGKNVAVFEVKGFSDSKFPIKKKMFLKWLVDNGKTNYSYFEVHSKKNVLQAINIIKALWNI